MPTRVDLLALEIAHERELREAREQAVEQARQLQADEYARRLLTLNHAHEQAVEAQRATVPREIFDQFVKENAQRVQLAYDAASGVANKAVSREAWEALQKEIDVERTARIRLEGQLSTWRYLVALLGIPGLVGALIGVYTVTRGGV